MTDDTAHMAVSGRYATLGLTALINPLAERSPDAT